MKKIVVLSGAGVSAESGIKTFRDSDGLWENYPVEEVASIDGWYKNKELVLNFYNARRHEIERAVPNEGHKIIADLEQDFDVSVVTQNIDNLHERAGSTKVIHLHGEIIKARSENDPDKIIEIGYHDIKLGDKAPDGSQLRPFIVWFGEAVPKLNDAAREVQTAEILIVIGTSLVVYPAAGLVNYTKPGCKIYIIDPKPVNAYGVAAFHILEKGSEGMKILKEKLLKEIASK